MEAAETEFSHAKLSVRMEKNNSEISVYRILDAAINRAAEGLRVVEDYLRMVVEDAHLSKSVKELRHRLVSSTSGLDHKQLIAARDSQKDVGRQIETVTEYERAAASSMVQANMARAQQAIRTIEEFTKVVVSFGSLTSQVFERPVKVQRVIVADSDDSERRGLVPVDEDADEGGV